MIGARNMDVISVDIQGPQDIEGVKLQAVLFQELQHILRESSYFRNRNKGTIFMDFIDHGAYKGSGFSVRD